MASTYSTNLRLELIGTGDQSGTWGTTTNTNLGTLLEQAITGVSNVSMTSDADYTLTTVNGSTDQARQAILNITSTVSLTASRNIIVPSVNKIYIVKNGTTGSQDLVIKTSTGTGITVINGKTTAVYCNGTNVYQAIDYFPSLTIDSLLVSGTFGAGSAALDRYNIYANKVLSTTNATQAGVYINTTTGTTATTVYGAIAAMQGAAGSSGSPYTTSNYYGFRSVDYVPGTYQTLTNQYGMIVPAQSGATFNYAFFTSNTGPSSAALSSISRASNVVSVATATAHGLVAGDTVIISSASGSFNGMFTVTTAGTTTTFQYGQTGSNETGATSTGYSTKANTWSYYGSGYAPNYFGGGTIIDVNSGMDALRITQSGGGNALMVEDSTNPDTTPFVIDGTGAVTRGATSAYSTVSITTATTPYIQTHGTTVSTSAIGQFGWNANPYYSFNKSAGALGVYTAVASGDILGRIQFNGADGSAFVAGALISAEVDGATGTNDMPGRLVFSTTADGASSPTERMRIRSDGNIGMGTVGFSYANLAYSKNITGATSAFGVYQTSTIQSDVTAAAYLNFTALNTAAASFTISGVRHYFASEGTIGAGSSVTNQYGFQSNGDVISATNNYAFYASNTAAVAATKTAYGFYSNINTATGGGTAWAFYGAGTANSYFGGRIGLNSTTLSGGTTVRNNLTITGATTSYQFYSEGGIASDVTSTGVAYASVISLNSANTTSGVYHFYANPAAGTAGSTITSQVGFYANDNLRNQGAATVTNAYGFYSGLLSTGGNAWAFYASGTAPSYFNGVITRSQAAPASKAAGGTATAAEMLGGLLNYTGAASTLTLPTGTNMDAGLAGGNSPNDTSFDVSVINTGSGTCTVTAATGFTIVGTATVTSNNSGLFRARKTAANTFVLYRMS
jgi:hypothetical protein